MAVHPAYDANMAPPVIAAHPATHPMAVFVNHFALFLINFGMRFLVPMIVFAINQASPP